MSNTSKQTIECPESSMAFKLEDGSIILINEKDISNIRIQIIADALVKDNHRVLMITDPCLEKAKHLYTVLTEQKEKMSKQLRDNYLSEILKLTCDKDYGITTLEDKIKKNRV